MQGYAPGAGGPEGGAAGISGMVSGMVCTTKKMRTWLRARIGMPPLCAITAEG